MSDLTEAQMRYNAAQYDVTQTAAYGNYLHWPSGEDLTEQGERRRLAYLDRIRETRQELEAAVLRLVAEHAEKFLEGSVAPVEWLRKLADDPQELSLLAVSPEEREEHLRPDLEKDGPFTSSQAEHAQLFRVTALPTDGRPPQSQYYPTARQAKFWRDQVSNTGYSTTVGRVGAGDFRILPPEELDRMAEHEAPSGQ